MEEKLIGKIKTTSIQKILGTVITFITDDNVIRDNKVKVVFETKTHYFNVENIQITDDNKLLVEANEVGYWATKFDRDPKFDLRSLTGFDISLIEDKTLLSKIDDMSCWC
jgi:uncharacterized cupredoxin-like copper-binding protein